MVESCTTAAERIALARPQLLCSRPPVRDNSAAKLLEIEGLHHSYPRGGFDLGPVDLTLCRGECLALVGPNGSGKTTLLKSIARLLSAPYRRLAVHTLNGVDEMPNPKELHDWARWVLYCFQNPDDQLFLSTVREEISETPKRLGRVDSGLIDRIIWEFELTPYLDCSPFDLPYPIRRLVSIAGALAAQTPVLLLDEPSAGLDDGQVHVLERAISIFRPADCATIVVSHDENLVSTVATRCVAISDIVSERQPIRADSRAMCSMHS
jgi:energy-coupling factor transport system ATP-binding protein